MKKICKLMAVLLSIAILLQAAPSGGLLGIARAEETPWNEVLLSYMTDELAASKWRSNLEKFKRDYARATDWLEQDAEAGGVELEGLMSAAAPGNLLAAMAARAAQSIEGADDLRSRIEAVRGKNDIPGALALYAEAAEKRSIQRLSALMEESTAFIVVRNYTLGGSHYAYTEAVSDDNNPMGVESNFTPGSQLVLLTLEETADGIVRQEESLLDCMTGVIRDPDVSPDGERVLFSMKENKLDDYHLYEMDLATRSTRRLTDGKGYADIEGKYLPDGNIVFNSTRCVQTVDCWKTPVSNLYLCDKDGGNIRRVGYDQVHTTYPTVTTDGRVIYTRWDYNDRTQMFVQGVFQMNPDGTNQTELFGNNSNFPTSLLHTREVPGTSDKYISIVSGHHTQQGGKLALLDLSVGRNDPDAVQFVFPDEEGTDKSNSVDLQGQSGPIYRYPYAFNETEFLVSANLDGWSGNQKKTPFHMYYMTADGAREILMESTIPASQFVPLGTRSLFTRASSVNYGKETGTFYIGNIYEGDGMEGVEKGTAKQLRIVALEYRAGAVGSNLASGSGTADPYTPVSTGNGAWDVKQVLGVVDIQEDGSALFEVPARVPVYFQVLDENGSMIQSMRSWSTLQPNETFSCVGCHEDKNTAPPAGSKPTQAMKLGVQKIVPEAWQTGERYEAYDPYQDFFGFSYNEEVQPILDRSCVACHNDRAAAEKLIYGAATGNGSSGVEQGDELLATGSDGWNYTFSNPGSGWQTGGGSGWQTGKAAFGAAGTPPGGAATDWSGDDRQEIWLTHTFSATAAQAQLGVLLELCHDEDAEIYLNGERVLSTTGYITEYQLFSVSGTPLREGRNTIAIHCRNTTGGRFIDCGVYTAQKKDGGAPGGSVFSLEGTPIVGDRERRFFNLSYLVLTRSTRNGNTWMAYNTQNDLTNWISSMSRPELLEPNSYGSNKSGLIARLRSGHGNLTDAEIRTIAAWIDLSVPFAGDYQEMNNWSESDKAYYEQQLAKRRAQEELDRASIEALQ